MVSKENLPGEYFTNFFTFQLIIVVSLGKIVLMLNPRTIHSIKVLVTTNRSANVFFQSQVAAKSLRMENVKQVRNWLYFNWILSICHRTLWLIWNQKLIVNLKEVPNPRSVAANLLWICSSGGGAIIHDACDDLIMRKELFLQTVQNCIKKY